MRLPRALASSGSAVAALSANFAAGCVGLFAPLGVAITALGLDWLHLWDVQSPILYAASAVSVGSLAHSAWRHRRPALLGLGLASLVALLYPLHQAMDVTVFRWSLNAGAAGLLLATAWSVVLARRAARSAPEPAGGHMARDRQGAS